MILSFSLGYIILAQGMLNFYVGQFDQRL